MDVDEVWAYRARSVDPLVEVRVVRIGSNKPARVLVRFAAEEFEGREEWVPPARLKVPWPDIAEFVACEQRWAAVEAATPFSERDATYWAVSHVLESVLPANFASEMRTGVTAINDLPGLADCLGIDAAELIDAPDVFEEDGAWVVPWPVTERIVRAAAARDPDTVLQWVTAEERSYARKKIYGTTFYMGRPRIEHHTDAEFYVDYESAPPNRPCWELLRQWAGVHGVDRYDELGALRVEVARIGRIAERAIQLLRDVGQLQRAQQLDGELGTRADELDHD